MSKNWHQGAETDRLVFALRAVPSSFAITSLGDRVSPLADVNIMRQNDDGKTFRKISVRAAVAPDVRL